jgi:NAD(P)-dependent dehydrogenase (short-subunit alcohol dehydrogenase family)
MRAIITGAASGIGRAVAERFVADDATASLLLVDISAEGLDQVANELRPIGARVTTMVADLADVTTPDRVIATARESMGGIDTLVSNAGIVRPGALEDLPLAEWEKSFAVNTRATWLLAKAAKDALATTRGCIVITTSISGTEPTPGLGAYSASKAALVILSQQLAAEFGPLGIRCNSVAPGYVRTALTDPIYADAEVERERAALLPLGRIGRASDIASAIAFLAGSDASYITGVNLLVDGGLSTHLMSGARGSRTLTRADA